MPSNSKSLFSRPMDLGFFIFFVTHIPIMFLVDLTPFYPASLHAALPFLGDIREYYIQQYHDRFFVNPPSWFYFYLSMEALYHIPLSVWAVGALWNDDVKVPMNLLIFACQTGFTTSTCLADMLSWDDFAGQQKMNLGLLYGSYIGVALVMGVCMYRRLGRQASAAKLLRKKAL